MASKNVDSIKLDIGGTQFEMVKSSLKIDATYFLGKNRKPDKDGCIFIDRSPKHFQLILDYMQGNHIYLPRSEKEIQEVKNEAMFYQLPGIMNLFFCSEEIPWNHVIDVETVSHKSKTILEKPMLVIFCLLDENRGFVRRPEKFDIIYFMKTYKDKVDIKLVIHSSQSIPISAFWNYRIYENGRETRGPSNAETRGPSKAETRGPSKADFVDQLEKDMKNAIHSAQSPNAVSKDNDIEFYVDGSSMRNGYSFSKGGWGVYCKTTGDHWKGYCRKGRQTNVVYELMAALVVTHKAKDVTQQIIRIHSDSKFTVESTNLYSFKWNSFGWLKSRNNPIENLEIIKAIDNNFQKLRKKGKIVSIQHVERKLNTTADKLADSGRDEHISEFMKLPGNNTELLVEYKERAKNCEQFKKKFQENIGNNPGDRWHKVYEAEPEDSDSIDKFIILG